MDWINRYLDQPLLNGASLLLEKWHVLSGRSPDRLEPLWNVAVLCGLFVASGHYLHGRELALGIGALLMLALPAVWRIWCFARSARDAYNVREYKLLRSRAIAKRDREWSLRLTVLVCASVLPFVAVTADASGAAFMLGASLWFVLTGPMKTYLDAAEPPMPKDGDCAFGGRLRFG